VTQSVGNEKVLFPMILGKHHGKQRKKSNLVENFDLEGASRYTRDSLPIFYVEPQHNPLIGKAHMTKKK
jgi:hypothetical protein